MMWWLDWLVQPTSETVDEGEGYGEDCAMRLGIEGDGASVHAYYLAGKA